jgi:FkbM family methyltransferase
VDVFHQIFIEEEYSPLLDLKDVGLAIDCGANVGYSSAYFLSRFPDCRVIAVEPDPDNFAMLEQNLRAYDRRVTLVRARIWPQDVPLSILKGSYRDGREWSEQVRPCLPGESSDINGVTIGSLLA